MKLIKVSARNLKGLSFDLDLKTVTFLVGANFKGKTARLDAIRLVLVGHLPELGKTARATFGICSGRDLEVRGIFDTGETIVRRWYLKGDSVKTEEIIPPAFEMLDEQLSVMLNAEEYFAKGPTDRTNYVFANCPLGSDEFAPRATMEAVERVLLGREFEDAKPGDVAKAVEKLRGAIADAERSIATEVGFPGWTAQSFIEWVLEAIKEEGANAAAVAVRMDKTAGGLAGLRAADEKPTDFATLDKARTDLNEAIEKLQNEKTRNISAYDAQRANRRTRERLTTELGGRATYEKQREGYTAKVAELERLRDQVPPASQSEVDDLRVEESGARSALASHQRDLTTVEDSIARNRDDLSGLDAKTACPYCGAVGDGWKSLKQAEIQSVLDALGAKKGQLEEHLAKLRPHAETLGNRALAGKNAIAFRAGKDREIASARQAIASIDTMLAGFAAKADELARIPQPDPAIEAAVDTTQAALNVKNEELREIENKRTAAIGRQHDLTRLAQAEESRGAARIEEKVAKAAVEELKAIQSRMVEDAFVPLLTTANAIFGDVLPTPLAYNAGEIGTWRHGAWVGHRTFSGAERALAYAAIQAALAARSPAKIMVLDELANFEDATMTKVSHAIVAAVKAGLLDQFVGIDPGVRRLRTLGAAAGAAGLPLTVQPIE